MVNKRLMSNWFACTVVVIGIMLHAQEPTASSSLSGVWVVNVPLTMANLDDRSIPKDEELENAVERNVKSLMFHFGDLDANGNFRYLFRNRLGKVWNIGMASESAVAANSIELALNPVNHLAHEPLHITMGSRGRAEIKDWNGLKLSIVKLNSERFKPNSASFQAIGHWVVDVARTRDSFVSDGPKNVDFDDVSDMLSFTELDVTDKSAVFKNGMDQSSDQFDLEASVNCINEHQFLLTTSKDSDKQPGPVLVFFSKHEDNQQEFIQVETEELPPVVFCRSQKQGK